MDIDNARQEYQAISPLADRLCSGLVTQLEELFKSESIRLGFPVQSRVKSWSSIAEKLERGVGNFGRIDEIQDVVGLRIIVLFRRDIDKIANLLGMTFPILKKADKSERLGDAQFGYQSLHYVVKLPDSWAGLPTFRGCGLLKAEIQLRTLAQHIWAEASHQLQYKQETNVPLPVRRSINRVSALLETIDLEFERVLFEREEYRGAIDVDLNSGILNVDLLEALLDGALPSANKNYDGEPYAELLGDLRAFGVDSVDKLAELLGKHVEEVLKQEEHWSLMGRAWNDVERVKRGVFLTHAGMLRSIMKEEFSSRWDEYVIEKILAEKARVSAEKKVQRAGADPKRRSRPTLKRTPNGAA